MLSLENNIIVRDVSNKECDRFLISCIGGIFNNLIRQSHISDGYKQYIECSVSDTAIHDLNTDTDYKGNLIDYYTLNVIDKVYRTLIDNNIEIYDILPHGFWVNKSELTKDDLQKLYNVYQYVKQFISFNSFLLFLNRYHMDDFYKLFIMYNFVKGKKDEIISKYHNHYLSKHLFFFEIWCNISDQFQDILIERYPNISGLPNYDDFIFSLLSDVELMQRFYNDVYKQKSIFNSENHILLNEALIKMIQFNVSRYEKYYSKIEDLKDDVDHIISMVTDI